MAQKTVQRKAFSLAAAVADPEKNDFANWVEGVFGQKQLGAAIRKSKTPRAAAKKLQAKSEDTKFWSFLI